MTLTIDRMDFRNLIKPLMVHFGDAKFKIGDEGIEMRAVTPKEHTIVVTSLQPDAFDYDGEERQITVSMSPINDALEKMESGDIKVEFKEDMKVELSGVHLTRQSGYYPDDYMEGVPESPPALDWQHKVVVNGAELYKGIHAITKIFMGKYKPSPCVILKGDTDVFIQHGEIDEDEVDHKITPDIAEEFDIKAPFEVTLQTMFLKRHFYRAYNSLVTLQFVASNKPIRFEYGFADGKGKVVGTVAPLIN